MDTHRCLIELLLIGIALAATVTDMRSGKVYNWLTYPAIGVGLLLNGLVSPGGLGFSSALIGLLIGGGSLFIAYLAGGLGGGDVKLVGAAGAFVGQFNILYVLLYSFIVGGILSLGMIVYKEGLGGVATRLFMRPVTTAEEGSGELTTSGTGDRLRFPFAVAVLVGVLWSFLERYTGHSLLDLVSGRSAA